MLTLTKTFCTIPFFLNSGNSLELTLSCINNITHLHKASFTATWFADMVVKELTCLGHSSTQIKISGMRWSNRVVCQAYLANYHASAVHLTTGEMEMNSCSSLSELSGKPTLWGKLSYSSKRSDLILTVAL